MISKCAGMADGDRDSIWYCLIPEPVFRSGIRVRFYQLFTCLLPVGCMVSVS